jgi:HMG (high mobility group) box
MKPTKESAAKDEDEARKPPAATAGHSMQSSEDEGREGATKGSSLTKAAIARKKSPRKKYKKKPKDMPHRALSAYNIFFRDERARILRARLDGNPGEIGTARAAELFSAMGKTIAKRWNELSPIERVPYAEAAGEDTARYRREMDLYRSSRAAAQSTTEGKEESEQANADANEPGRLQLAESRPFESNDPDVVATARNPSIAFGRAPRAQTSPTESKDPHDAAHNPYIAVASHQPFGPQTTTIHEASLSALNAAMVRHHQHQQQQLLQQQMLELRRGQEQLRNRESSLYSPSFLLGPIVADVLTPEEHIMRNQESSTIPSSFLQGLTIADFLTQEEEIMAQLSYDRLPSSSEQQQVQRMELPGNQYIRAALEQANANIATPEEQIMARLSYDRLVPSLEQQQVQQLELPRNQYIRAALEQAHANVAAANIVRQLQWLQQQESQQQASFQLQQPPYSTSLSLQQEAGALYSGLGVGGSLSRSPGWLSAAFQRLQQQTQQQAGASSFGASQWRPESNESNDEGSESQRTYPTARSD